MSPTFKKIPNSSTVDRIAAVLTKAALTAAEGSLLGSEASLVDQLGISAPTLRQAARLLESEQLLEIRRGVAGGYYVRRPTMEVVTRLAAVYLTSESVSVAQTLVVMEPLIEMRSRLAARCQDAALLDELRRFSEREGSGVLFETEFSDLVARMAGNTALRMIMTIFTSYTMLRDSIAAPPSEEVTRVSALRSKLIEALLCHDEGAAAVIAKKRFALYRDALLRQAGPAAGDLQ